MIIGNQTDFFLQLDVVEKTDDNYWFYGLFNFWIDDIPYPGNGTNITLNSTPFCVVSDYKNSLNYEYDGSNIPFEQIDFEEEDNYFDETIKHHMYNCDFGELFQYGLHVKFEIVGETLRFFYSQNEGPWQLKEIPLAYYDSIMKKLDLLIQDGFKPLLDSRFGE
ncbi:MAG: hypothetical protein J6M05_05705 [Cardiobacteriaceae bacterium]|nr:hypothetical protein [Cardiobacteriaceae bacterium]